MKPSATDLNNLYRGFVSRAHTAELADGVFATVQPDGSWGLSNAGFFHAGSEVAVVDSLLTEGRTRAFLNEIKQRVPSAHIQYLINTHHHSDHTFGNYLFEDAVIIGHTDCRADLLEVGLSPTEKDPFVPWGNIRLRPPELTTRHPLVLHLGCLEVQLIPVAPAHTRNDLIVWLPQSRVLFTGDVLFNGATPILTDGSLTGSVAALEVMASLEPEVIVPGHGELADLSTIQQWRSYFTFLAAAAAQACVAGMSPLEAARSLDLGEFATWQHPERIVLNLHRAMAETQGASPGVRMPSEEIFADMLRLKPTSYGHKLVRDREAYVEAR